MKRIIYQSQGTDDMKIACATVEEAINCFRADAESMLHESTDLGPMTIDLTVTDMSDEQIAALVEV